jgi:RecJ-like exonuclease
MKKLLAVVLAAALVITFVVVAFAQGKAAAPVALATGKKHEYVGATKCKMCHLKEFKSWEVTKMAKAFGVLKPEEQKDPKCNVCHMTGILADGTVLEGVQCEACHGPGADYKAKATMEDKKLAAAAGLVAPTEQVCMKCHKKEGNPNYKPLVYAEAIKDKVAMHEHFAKEPVKK